METCFVVMSTKKKSQQGGVRSEQVRIRHVAFAGGLQALVGCTRFAFITFSLGKRREAWSANDLQLHVYILA